MYKYWFLLAVFLHSCSNEEERKYDKAEKLMAFRHLYMDVDFENERIIIDNANFFNIIEDKDLGKDTIKLSLTEADYRIMDSLYLVSKIYDVPSGEIECDVPPSSSNHLKIIFEGENKSKRKIEIWESYKRNTEINKRLISYVDKIHRFLDEKMKYDSLYQANKDKIELNRRL